MEQGATARYFRTLIGQTLAARGLDGSMADLILQSVTTREREEGAPEVLGGDSFVLAFRGPLSPVLPSAIVDLTPPSASPMAIFMVPLGPEDDAMQYEAVFNRMRSQ